ncbi:MAG TPA: hypothetical protein VD861_00875 [Pyrinomonadaceae bacterium]|nr:hypothetical protein [Pyrinomonadaceae bacterium]
MSVTRRSFLRSGATAALTTAVALKAAPMAFAQIGAKPDPTRDVPIPYEARQSPLVSFKRETFEPYVGGIFRVRAGAHAVDMTLTKVRGCEISARGRRLSKKEAKKTECFALVFKSDEALTDLTSIYDIEHAALGKFALFLTRRDGPTRGTHFYEAVFNHAL